MLAGVYVKLPSAPRLTRLALEGASPVPVYGASSVIYRCLTVAVLVASSSVIVPSRVAFVPYFKM